MKQPNASSPHDWMDARVEAYVDGDLPTDEVERFESILDEEPYWKAQVHHAERIQGTLHDLPQKTAPPELAEEVFAQTSRAHQPLPWWRESLQNLMQTWRALVSARRNPVVDYAVGFALVAVAAFFIFNPIQPTPNGTGTTQDASQLDLPASSSYSASEIERARAHAKWTFGYLSNVGEETSVNLRTSLKRAFEPVDAQFMMSTSQQTPVEAPELLRVAAPADADSPDASRTSDRADASSSSAWTAPTPSAPEK